MSLWQMSLQGGVMILLAALLRVPLRRRLPKWTFPAIWTLALARLLLPIALPLPRGISERLPYAQSATVFADTAQVGTAQIEPPLSAAETAEAASFPWLWLWAAGAALLALYFAVAYGRGYCRFATSLPVNRPEILRWQKSHPLFRAYKIRESDRISTPLTYGVLRPVILLPKSARQADEITLNALLTHEWTHICRFDAAFKLALAAALCLHWPNPAVWLLYALANRDLEFACDEAALAHLGAGSRASYARALLCMEALRDGSLPFCSGFGKTDIEERILSIMKTKKASPRALFLALLLLLVSATAFASPKTQDEITFWETDTGNLWTLVDGETGQIYYRDNEGEDWKALTPEEAKKRFPPITVEWWTADEYAKWLENEKKELEAIIGTRAWTRGDGWFTWTREKVDEAIARYEQTLRDIQSGLLISKTVNGSSDTVLAQGTATTESASESIAITSLASPDAETVVLTEAQAEATVALGTADVLGSTLDERFLREYGLTYQDGVLTWEGRRVSRFVDFAPDGGVFTYSDDAYRDGLSLQTVYDAEGRFTAVEPF